jgi:hypothetical protein
MGLIEASAQNVAHFCMFFGNMLKGRKREWTIAMGLMRGPTALQREVCLESRRQAQDKFRPKRMVQQNGTFRLGEPGERGGCLYSTIETTTKDMSEFGIGIGLYFDTMVGYSRLLLLQLLVILPSTLYLDGPDYSPAHRDTVPLLLRGSAVCTQLKQVVVTDLYTGGNVTATQVVRNTVLLFGGD